MRGNLAGRAVNNGLRGCHLEALPFLAMNFLRRIAFQQVLCMGLAARLPVLKALLPTSYQDSRYRDAGQRIVRV
jgi:hypothetical protein